MISPCECSGTMKYIHYSCLKNWLDQKKQVKEGYNFTSFMWEGLECELCKTSFEGIFVKDKDGNQTIDLLGMKFPTDSHFIFLESVNTEEILKKKRVKIVHIVDFKNMTELSLGRGHDCQVRITDISISRKHAAL